MRAVRRGARGQHRARIRGLDLWSPPGAPPKGRATFDELERRGLALCFESRWSLAYLAPLELVPSLRRVRARAHAARIPDAPAPARSLAPAEQILHDAAAVGATIAHGGIQVKADGQLYAKALPKLAAALSPLSAPGFDFDAHGRSWRSRCCASSARCASRATTSPAGTRVASCAWQPIWSRCWIGHSKTG